MSFKCYIVPRAYKEEKACNYIDIEILEVTKIDFKLVHFRLNNQYEHLNTQCGIQPLHCDRRSFSGTGSSIRTIHLPVHAVYSVVHLWCHTMLSTTRDSAAADNKQHLTVVNDLAGVSIGTLAISVILQ